MNAYIYQADLYCEDCAKEMSARAMFGRLGSAAADSDDSDVYPQGPYSDGGGESDGPQHCARCREFLENPLTPDGIAYVRDSLARGAIEARAGERTGDSAVLDEWASYYADYQPSWGDYSAFKCHADLLAYAFVEGVSLNSRETIVDPGPFEAEDVSILYWHEVTLGGGAGEPSFSNEYHGGGAEYWELDADTRAICGEPAASAHSVRLAWDSQGFYSLAYLSEDERSAAIADDEANYPADDDDESDDDDARCPQCESLMIQGVYCHETGCPNARKVRVPNSGGRFDSEWITPESDDE